MNKKKVDNYNSVFAKNLRDLMQERETTQQELANAAQTTRQAISQYADGSVQPNVDKIRNIANFFNVSSDYLLGLTNVKIPETDIQAISGYTGLSEGAIYKTKELKVDKEAELKLLILNMLFEKGFIEDFIEAVISDLQFSIIRNNLNSFYHVDMLDNVEVESLSDIVNDQNEMSKWKFSILASKSLDDIKKIIMSMKESQLIEKIISDFNREVDENIEERETILNKKREKDKVLQAVFNVLSKK